MWIPESQVKRLVGESLVGGFEVQAGGWSGPESHRRG